MQFFRRLKTQIFPSQPEPPAQVVLLTELLQKARRAQYTEKYDEALDYLAEAMELANAKHDKTTQVDITLSRADILIAQSDYHTATQILTELRDESEANEHRAPMAYAIASLGVAQQQQNHLEAARTHYEQARKIAGQIRTLGADGRATAHLADVYLLHDGNASYAAHLLADAIKKLQSSGDRELLGYFQGQLGKALIESGQQTEGLDYIAKGLEVARAIKHRPQIRRLSLLLAHEHMQLGQYHKAQQFYSEALGLYPDPHPLNIEYATALNQMSIALHYANDAGLAQEYAKNALTVAQQLGEPHLLAQAKGILGLILLPSDDDSEQALEYLQEAAASYEDLPTDDIYIEILRSLATYQSEHGETSLAEAAYEQAIQAAQELPAAAAQVHTDLANFYGQQNQLREALEQFNHAVRLFSEQKRADRMALLYCDMGSLYARLGDGRMALRQYESALVQLSQIDDALVRGVVLANVAVAYSDYGDIDSALDFFRESIEIAKTNNQASAEMMRRGNYSRLLSLVDKGAAAIQEATQSLAQAESPFQQAVQTNNLALAYRASGQYEQALSQHQVALAEPALVEESFWQATVYADMGDTCFLCHKALDQAAEYYDQARSLAEANNYIAILIQATIGLSRLALINSNYEKAATLLTEIEATMKRAYLRRLLAQFYELQSRLSAAQDNAETAQAAWEQAAQLRRVMQMPDLNAEWL